MEDDYGEEFDKMVEETEAKVTQVVAPKTDEKDEAPIITESKPAAAKPKRSFLQNCVAGAQDGKPEAVNADKAMEEMFAKMMNPQGTANDMPDPAKLAQMLNLDGGKESGVPGDGKLPFDENAMKDMEKLFGEISKEMGQSGPNPGMPSAAPGQQPEGGFDSMFKAFEKASQEHDKTQKKSGPAGGDPLAAMLGALGGADGQDFGDDKMMGMLKGLMGQMGEAGPDGKGGSEDMFGQFGDFLK